MKWRTLTGIALALSLAQPVWGAGVTISIPYSYCPAVNPSSSASSTTTSAPTPSITPGEPIVLSISANGAAQYIRADGTITNDSSQAVNYVVSPSGQLIGGGGFVSTSGDVASQPFAISPETPGMKRTNRIFARFVITADQVLEWINDAFTTGKATFCVAFPQTLIVVFNGASPAGCVPVQLVAIPAVNVQASVGISTTRLPQLSVSQLPYSSVTPTDSGPTSSVLVSASTGAPSPISSGMGSGSTSLLGSGPVIMQTRTDTTFSSTAEAYPTSFTGTPYPAPTSTGTPNCYDRSPFDGTVNNDYLILCDTDLPDLELSSVPASNIDECIDACTAFVPTSQVQCVAVTFNILATENPCQLKYGITAVNRGADAFSQAAIVVNKPYAPMIVFSDLSDNPATSTGTTVSTTTVGPPPPVSTMTTTPSGGMSQNTLPPNIATNPTTKAITPTSQPTTQQNTPSSSNGGVQSSRPASSTITDGSSAANSVSNGLSGGQRSQVSTMTTTINSAASAQTSIPTSSSAAVNIAASSSTNNVASSTPAGSSIPMSVNQGTSRSSSQLASTMTSTSASTAAGLATTTTASMCTAIPTTTNLCTTYNHQALNVNGDGYCYEVECGTALQGTVVTGQSTTATSLKNCIGVCTTYNVALPFGCLGVNYLGSSAAAGSNNCLLLSAITGTTASTTTDSGRLIYAAYPAINDPNFLSSSTTSQPIAVVTTQTSAAVTTQSLTVRTTQTSGAVTTQSSTVRTTQTSAAVIVQTSATVTTQTSVIPASSVTTTTTSTIPYVPPSCVPAPSNASTICPGVTPQCFQYTYTPLAVTYNATFETECTTQFTGSPLQPVLAYDLNDCIGQCQYSNTLTPNSCIGVTFNLVSPTTQGSANNCFRYSTITCATRGNATFASARMLYSGYPQIVDYSDPSYLCGYTSTAVTTTQTSTTLAQTTTASTLFIDLSRASSTTFPQAWPQDPVCENNLRSKYFGGQLSLGTSSNRLYDIECASDYNTAANNPFGATTQPTYNSCGNQCDVAALGGNPCAAFSWSAVSGVCTLLRNVTNDNSSITNLAQTNYVHSGRFLVTSAKPPAAQTQQLYLKRPVPFLVGPLASGSSNTRDYPGGTNTYFNGWSDSAHATLLNLSYVLGPGYNFKIYGQSTPLLWVSPHFWFTNTDLGVTASTQSSYSVLTRNNDAAPNVFPTSSLPSFTIAPFWTIGHVLGASQQGIYYQIDLISTDRYGISIEWYLSHFQDGNVYHAIMTYDTGNAGVWGMYWFNAGVADGVVAGVQVSPEDQGLRQTVGAQGDPSVNGQGFTYCHGQQACVTAGSRMTINTGTNSVDYYAPCFNAASFTPGTWDWTKVPYCPTPQ